MALKSRIKSAVNTAFETLKDLSYEAIFYTKTVQNFDFLNGSTIETTDQYTANVFLEDKTSVHEGIPVTRTTLTMKTDPSVDINRYTEVLVEDKKYRCNVISKNDFITVINITRF
jgi:hypothetical protein